MRRTYSSSSSSSSPRSRGQRLLLYPLCLLLLLSASCWLQWYFHLDGFFEMLFESLSNLGSYLYVLISMIRSSGEISMIRSSGEIGKKEDEAMPLAKKNRVDDQVFFAESPIEELGKKKTPIEHSGFPPILLTQEDLIEPPLSPEKGAYSTQSGTTSPPAPSHSAGGGAAPSSSIHPDQARREPVILNAKDKISVNLTTLYGSFTPGEEMELTEEIFSKKQNILEELRRLTGPVNAKILWQDDGDTIRNPQSGQEYPPKMLDLILKSLQQEGVNSPFYNRFLNERMETMPNSDFHSLRVENLPQNQLNELNLAKLLEFQWERNRRENIFRGVGLSLCK